MATDVAYPPSRRAERTLPLGRWCSLVALGVAEVLGLTLAFDMRALVGKPQWWAEVLVASHFLPQVALTVVIALALFGGGRLWEGVARLAVQDDSPRRVYLALSCHLLVFAAFARVTAVVAGADFPWSDAPVSWL